MTGAERLAIGTVQFGTDYGISNSAGQVPVADVAAILDRGRAAGIPLLDTAEAYGQAESVLGQVGTEGFGIVGKLGRILGPAADVRDEVEQRVAAILRRLGVERLHGLMLHAPTQLLEDGAIAEQVIPALEGLVARGLTAKIGVSTYDPRTTRQLFEMFEFTIIQVPVCPIDARWEEDSILDVLRAKGVEIHARSAFLQGLLLLPPADLPSWATPWAPLLGAFREWALGQVGGAADLTGRSETGRLAAACVALTLGRPDVARLVVGVTSIEQLDLAVAGAGMTLDSRRLPVELKTSDPRLLEPSRWPT